MIIPENENESHKKPLVLSIAGSDPTGGAGIQADLRTFESLGVHGFTVITAITVQTTEKVLDWESISTDLVRTQLHTILENYPIEFMKCGMVPNKEIIQIIKEVKEKYEVPLIFDPILKSGSGKELSEKGIKESMIENLFPSFNETDVLTPNSKEVKALTGIEIKKVDDILTAGKKFEQMGISSILFKGGHISEEKNQVIDYLYQDGGIEMFPHKRVKNATKTHGTGCIFSAALTGNLAIYRDLYTAVQKTEDQIERYFYHLYYVPTKNEKSPKEKVAILDTTGDPQRKG